MSSDVKLRQRSLFDAVAVEPAFDEALPHVERIELGDGAWVDVARGLLVGQEALFERLRDATKWAALEREMYDRTVDVPRLLGTLDGKQRPPVVERLRVALSARYREEFVRVTAALYRDGQDSVAFHGDTTARVMDVATVATLSLGGARRFLLRPTGGGASTAITLSGGDLVVMGGTCQRTFQHAIPKAAHAEPRIAVMFRPIWTAPARRSRDG